MRYTLAGEQLSPAIPFIHQNSGKPVENRTLGNKYQIVERLGRGGMAEVYRANHITLDRQVAIKVLHEFLADDPEFKSRFEKEARNIARLKHPHIVQVYDFEFDSINENYYMVMELIEGITLKDFLQGGENKGNPLPLEEALRITREAASALAYAHKAGMIHRDVKPANLLLDSREDNRVVLTDFGIAKMITSGQHTVTGGLIGTPAYMSPEQGVGETGDERSDLYSLGVILFQLVTGQLPYDAETPLALILKHLNEPIPSACALNDSLPDDIDNIIAKLMAKEAEERYQNARELIDDINSFAERFSAGIHTTMLVKGVTLPDVKKSKPDSEISTDDTLDGPTQAYNRAETSTNPVINVDTPVPDQEEKQPKRYGWVLPVSIVIIILVVAGVYFAGESKGIFPTVGFLPTKTPEPELTITEQTDILTTTQAVIVVEESATNTPTPSATATSISTSMPPTFTPTLTPTSTHTSTPTLTDTDIPTQTEIPLPTETSVSTATLTPNSTQTLAVERTETAAACMFDYAIIEQTPEDGEPGGFFRIRMSYERTIKLLNTGSCAWERNSSLAFINGSGESFGAGPRIFIRQSVDVGGEVDILFEGTLPSRGSVTPISGQWQLRTPGQIAIGEPITISVMVYDPGS